MVSVVIPAYEMGGRGVEFLDRALQSCNDSCVDEIIISSQEKNDGFLYLAKEYGARYFQHNVKRNGAASNLNHAIEQANGDIIKILFQDDTLSGRSLEPFENINHWGFCTSKHNIERPDHVPYHNPDLKSLALGKNTYGSPSALAFRKTELRFDEHLKFLFDCEFYVRMTQKYGLPDIVDTFVNITEWEGMATNTVCTGQVRLIDAEYISYKHANL
jgi:glycosyltransferase involved in cell wall biosynthesis